MRRIVEFRHERKGHQVTDACAKLARLAAALNAGRALPSLVLLTDDERLPDPLRAADALPRGGMIVIRARDSRRRTELAVSLAKIAFRRELVLLIADDPELAASLGVHGAHFPETRAGEIAHWHARRPHWLITASAHSLRACARAAHCGADAVFLSPIFATKSHPGHATITPIRLRLIAQLVPVSLYALGGIDGHNAARLRRAKLAGLAAIGALTR
jgi:thiamine-phosphate pyrophosphorylase